ncbi:MAG: site-specific integrase [Chloroflexota bacterium]
MYRALFRVLTVLNPLELEQRMTAYVEQGTRKHQVIYDFDWTQLTYTDMLGLQDVLLSRFSRRTAEQAIYAVRRVLEESACIGHIDRNTYERTVDLPRIPRTKSAELPGRTLEANEIHALLTACMDDDDHSLRNGAILALMIGLGLRCIEVRRLKLTDYDVTAQQLRVPGKGSKDRVLPLTPHSVAWLERWLKRRGSEPGPLFFSHTKRQVLVNRHISRSGLEKIIHRVRERAGVAHFSPHDLRRTAITDLLSTEELLTVTYIAGHSSPDVTRVYDRRPLENVKEAARTLTLSLDLSTLPELVTTS